MKRFKALVQLFSWVYFTGPLYCAAGLAQQQGRGGREAELEDHLCLHHFMIHHKESCSQYCVRAGSRAVVFSSQAEGESFHCTKVQRESWLGGEQNDSH